MTISIVSFVDEVITMVQAGSERLVNRRTVLGGTTLAGAVWLSDAAGAVPGRAGAGEVGHRRDSSRGETVAVFGAGIGGLTAAHELVDRGYRVSVYERKALGGKSRTIPVPDSGTGGRGPLPGEHGARGFTSFYQHIHDTMGRIPAGSDRTVYDNLIPFSFSDVRYPRAHGRADGNPLMFGFYFAPGEVLTPQGLNSVLLEGILKQQTVPPWEAEYLAERFIVYLTSSEQRRFGQWEHTNWWDFVGARTRSPEYQHLAATGLTRALVAAKEQVASTRTIGNMAEQFVIGMINEVLTGGKVYQVLNGPTDEAWLTPWIELLRSRGVRFEPDHTIERFHVSDERITGAQVRQADGRSTAVEADWYVCAVPTDRARELFGAETRRVDPSLAGLDKLTLDWMNGIQFFLEEDVSLGAGYNIYLDAPWRLTSYTQNSFWDTNYNQKYGDGASVNGLTVDIADWDTPGVLFGKPAKQCHRDEIVREVWAQLQAALNDRGEAQLPDNITYVRFLDPAIEWSATLQRNVNDEPLLVNTVGSWQSRPSAQTNFANLFLASDYVRTDFDLASMEAANEAARRAVNALLENSGATTSPAKLFTRKQLPEFDEIKKLDADRYRRGQPNLFDHPR